MNFSQNKRAQALRAFFIFTACALIDSQLLASPSKKPIVQPNDVQAEVMISRSETKAIESLQSLLKQAPDNPDLWLRLAELYTRKSKTSRFFELSRDSAEKAASLALVGDLDKNTKSDLKMALEIYQKILKNFPTYTSTDTVLFHAAFTSQQLNDLKLANTYHAELVRHFPNSKFVPDAYLALGELAYDSQNFSQAEKNFVEIKRFPDSRVHAYGLYKLAWSYYNEKKNDEAIQSLVLVVDLFSEKNLQLKEQKHNLRPEALRDLSLFYGETHSAKEAYRFFSELATKDELADSLINLGKLYLAHNRENEMKVFLNDLISAQNPSPQTLVRAGLLLAEANEHLKNTVEVNRALADVAKICKNQKLTECDENYAHYVHEVSHRMWDQWIKTKKDQKLAQNMREILELRLDSEPADAPDLATHLLYADLIFQLGEFGLASTSYEWIFAHATDSQMKEDTLYSAIASEQKNPATPTSQTRMLTLTDTFLKIYPHAKDADSVRYARGFTLYTMKQDPEAEKILVPLAAAKEVNPELRAKSQDLVLDIFNRGQRFEELKKMSLAYSSEAAAPTANRAEALKRLSAEADYSDVQKQNEKANAHDKLAHLLEYYHAHEANAELGNQALYQAIALAYGSGLDVDGAFASLEYAKKNKDDHAKKALADAAITFLENGFFEEGLQATESLLKVSTLVTDITKYQRLRADIYFLLGRNKEALNSTFELAASGMNKTEQAELIGQMYTKFKNSPNSDEYKKIAKKITDENIEPYVSEFAVTRAEQVLQEKNYSEAFRLAKNIMARKTLDVIRARARLIQASILQKEFTDQSLRTTIAKLNLVLGLKTEKLEKAQEAFVNAQKISTDADTRVRSLRGLRDCYANFVDSLKSLRLKNDLGDSEQKTLGDAVEQITTPMLAKLKDLDQQLASAIAKTAGVMAPTEIADSHIDYANLPADGNWAPKLNPFTTKEDSLVLPTTAKFENQKQFRDQISQHLFTGAVQLGKRLAQNSPKNYEGVYYQAIAYEQNRDFDRSDYLFSVLKRKSDFKKEIAFYEGILAFKRGDPLHAEAIFADDYGQGVDVKETRLAHLRSLYSQKQFADFIQASKILTPPELETADLVAPLAEAFAAGGDTKSAWATLARQKNTSPESELMRGHLAENYDFDFTKAGRFYEKAGTLAKDANLKTWLTRKIEWLKNPKSPRQIALAKDSNK